MNNLSILLVDDEAAICDLMRISLQRGGHVVATASDGRAAIGALGRQRFDLIITDVLMPEADGLEVIEAAKRLQPNARIVTMSGGSAGVSAALCLRLGKALADGPVLRKPFTPDELFAAAGMAAPLPA